MAKAAHQAHKAQARQKVVCGVLTVSDTRTAETDSSGRLIRELLIQAQHTVPIYHIRKDDSTQIQTLLQELMADARLEAIIVNGGTGVARRDVTFAVVARMLEKELPGFGELFRMFSYEDIGSAAMLSRATAGICGGKVLFSLPGSSGAVRLAMEKLILPELPHIVFELNK